MIEASRTTSPLARKWASFPSSSSPSQPALWCSDKDVPLIILCRPACSALPFILEALNLRLSSSTQKDVHQRQLNYYHRIMTLFRTQHDHTECVTTAVNTILQVAEPEISGLLISQDVDRNTGSLIDSGPNRSTSQAVSRLSSWSDVFANDPLFYLRLSLSLDLALSRGKAPHVADLPVWTMDPSFVGFQAPPISLSFNTLSPWMPQTALPGPEQSRFVEVSEDEGSSVAQDCKTPVFVSWRNSPSNADGGAGPSVEEPANFDFPLPWSFDMPAGAIEQWFDAI